MTVLDASVTVRLPRSEATAFVEACGGKGEVSTRLRSLMRQYVKKRAGERAKAPVAVPDEEATP
jgi:hypothetical protein